MATIKKIILFLLISTSLLAQTTTPIIFSEIMFHPTAANSEFIELFNSSQTDTIDLTKYQIQYYTSATDTITAHESGLLLQPHQYAVIFEGDYDFAAGVYKDIIHANALVLTIDNNSFGSAGMSNSSDRTVHLINTVGDTLTGYTYTANNAVGISDEKILMTADNSISNWGNSFVVNGTPGFANSVSPLNNDLEIADISLRPETLHEGDALTVSISINNIGLNDADNFTIEIFNDLNGDSVAQSSEKIYSDSLASLLAGDSLSVQTNVNDVPTGTTFIIAQVVYLNDQNSNNNTVFANISVLPKASNFADIVINEIMYKPLSGEPEWIELFNRSGKEINIKDWRIFDLSSNANLSSNNLIISPNEYFVVADDNSILDFFEITSKLIVVNIPSLNNTGDNLKLKDGLGNIIDSVNYLSSWGNDQTGVSLERIDINLDGNISSNWASSTSSNFATPGVVNSVTPKNIDLAVKSFYMNKNYVELNSSALLYVTVSNLGIQTSSNITVRLFNDINNDRIPLPKEKVDSTTVSTLNSNNSITVNFNFDATILGANNLITEVFQPQDEFHGNDISTLALNVVEINEARNDLVINEIMYAPSAPEPEWIEIYNRSTKTINLSNYQIADSKDTVRVIFSDTIIMPDSFFVIAKDSSFYEKYGNVSNVVISYFPSLNNSGDAVVILDSLSRVIDSVNYKFAWGGTKGKSLERINPDAAPNDSSNWGTSVLGATPCTKNSISFNDYDISVASAFTTPSIPNIGGNIQLSALLKNFGKLNSNFSVQLFADNNHDQTADELLESIDNLNIPPTDSLIINFNYSVHDIQNEKDFFIITALPNDANTANDTLYFSVRPSFGRNAIQLNEIMFRPANGEPEWIEIYNATNKNINLKNWTVGDIRTTPTSAVITNTNLFVPAKSLFVIAKDSLILSYHSTFPSGLIVANFPNLNNDVDGVVLQNQYGLAIDSLEYNNNWKSKVGYSIERISLDSASADSSNWAISEDVEQSTPGRINSIAFKAYDLQVVEISTNPKFPVAGDNLNITTKIFNRGLVSVSDFSIKLFYGIQNPTILLNEFTEQSLLPGDTLTIASANTFQLTGAMQIASEVIYLNDENVSNNYLSVNVNPGFARNSLLISEVMIEPLARNPEWIELKNVSGNNINLKDWSIGNLMPSLSIHTITDSNIILAPNQYLLLASVPVFQGIDSNAVFIDANIGGLNNNLDGIVIFDFRNAVIDSLFYDNSFDIEKGFSLERISFTDSTNNPINWLSSIEQAGGSPGFNNSVSHLVHEKNKSVVINEFMYNPYTDNAEFIELYNSTDKYIELGGFGIFDQSGNFFKVTNVKTELAPQKYFVVAADSSILQNYSLNNLNKQVYITKSPSFSLSNTKDEIILVDAFGGVIDSVKYTDKWNNQNIAVTKNKSLERVNPNLDSNDPTNWSTSVSQDGATPAQRNSIYVNSLSSSTKISISPNPFSPDNDGFEDFSIIHYNLTQTVAQIRIKVFDARGRKVRSIVNNYASGSSGSVIFDGLDDNGRPLKIGIYILFIEALNSSSGVVETLKEPIVIARKL